MLQRFRESLSLILIAVLPMHAMLVTVATHMLAGRNHAPLLVLALWKEALLGGICVIALVEMLRTKEPELRKSIWRIDLLDACILAALVLGLALSLMRDVGTARMLLGLKYDFLPLLAFFLLRRVLWTRHFLVMAARTIVMVGVIAAVYGIATLFIPLAFFTVIGYSDLHSLYLPNAALASFQFLEGTEIRRIQSFMSGPNQLGLWLLLPLAANLVLLLKSLWEQRRIESVLYVLSCALMFVALYLTYSRSAWIGAGVMLTVVVVRLLLSVIRRRAHRVSALIIGGLLVIGIALFGIVGSPQVFVRAQSLKGHIEKPLAALQIMRTHPLGLGLGTAGPASNRLSDTCVFLVSGADAGWAKDRPDLCVFVGDVQTQPTGTTCNCPLLTENWYLQWGVEMGFLGLILSLAIILLALLRGLRLPVHDLHLIPALALLGIAVGGLFLHSFEDAAVAYTVWLLMSSMFVDLSTLHIGSGRVDEYIRD